MFIINFCLNMFRASYAPLQENKDRVLLHLVFCSGSAGCGWQRPTTATNHIQQNQNNTPNAVTGPLIS